MSEDKETAAVESGEAVSADVIARTEPEQVDWRDMALRLRAEMDNYHKRQQRWAESQVAREKGRYLSGLLDVMDLVEATLAHAAEPERNAVSLIHAALQKLLKAEGVEPIPAVDMPFDPAVHEAVAKVPPVAGQPAPLWVVAEERRGYRLGDTLLRASRVVVAGEE